MKKESDELDEDIAEVSKESEEDIRKGFSSIFERIYKKFVNLLSKDKS